MAGDLFIQDAISQIHKGIIRIPEFQRGFVWEAENVAYLMDSIYKGYPFGSLVLWRTREKLKSERKLGPYSLSSVDAPYYYDYVLDGQQRLTSIFGVFQTTIEPDEEPDWVNVYFDLRAEADHQDTQFYPMSPVDVEPDRHIPLRSFFDVLGYREATERLSVPDAERVGRAQAVFQQARIPTQYIETEDKSKVAIVFERVNRRGVELDVLQLLSAWTWSEEFDLRTAFEDLAEDLAPFGFGAVGEDTNLLLRCCAAVVQGDSSPDKLIDLSGYDVRNRFDEIVNGIQGAIDFLQRNLKVETLGNLPYSTLIVPLSVFFAVPKGKSASVSNIQRATIIKWFWRSCFSRRYSAGTNRNLNRDIGEMKKLRRDGSSQLADIHIDVDAEYFTSQKFTVNSVHTNTFVLMLAQKDPLSFVSGSPIDLKRVLQSYNRNEFHHLYPQAYLRGLGIDSSKSGRLANFAFMSSRDNKKLGGSAPSAYKAQIDPNRLYAILSSACCPESLFDDDYDKFLDGRAQALADYAKSLIS